MDVNLELDMIDAFIEFFIALIHCILYKTKIYPDEIFTKTNTRNGVFWICNHPSVKEYVECCSVKIVILLRKLNLNGFQLNILEQSVVKKRFVVLIEKPFVFNTITNELIQELCEKMPQTLESFLTSILRLNLDEKPIKTHFSTRFQIVLGLESLHHDLLEESTDSEQYIPFPWAKPRNNLNVATIDWNHEELILPEAYRNENVVEGFEQNNCSIENVTVPGSSTPTSGNMSKQVTSSKESSTFTNVDAIPNLKISPIRKFSFFNFKFNYLEISYENEIPCLIGLTTPTSRNSSPGFRRIQGRKRLKLEN